MTQHCKWFALVAVLFAVPLLSATPQTNPAQFPPKGEDAPVDKKTDKKPLVAKKPSSLMGERLDIKELAAQPVMLKEALG